MQFDPKWVFWLGVAVTIETAIGQGAIPLANVAPETWVPYIKGWSQLLGFIGTTFMTAMSGFSSRTAGPLVTTTLPIPVDQAKKVAAVLLAIGVTLALSLGSASAQMRPPVDPTPAILAKLVTDSQAALDDATAHNDTIAAQCYSAINAMAAAKAAAAGVNGGGALLVFQKVRDVTRMNSTPQGTALIAGCAALVQDAKVNMLQFFTNIGGSLLLKGLLIP